MGQTDRRTAAEHTMQWHQQTVTGLFSVISCRLPRINWCNCLEVCNVRRLMLGTCRCSTDSDCRHLRLNTKHAQIITTTTCNQQTAPVNNYKQNCNLIKKLFRYIYTHTPVKRLLVRDYPGEPVWGKVKPIWILLKQETVSGSAISRSICKSAPRSRQMTMPAPHHSKH